MATRFAKLQKEVNDEPTNNSANANTNTNTNNTNTNTRSSPFIAGPSPKIQHITLYHFYRGNAGFWIDALHGQPNFPNDYCKVGLFNATFADAVKLSVETGWNHSKEIITMWGWAQYKVEESHYRTTLKGDVLVEQDGTAWFWEGNSFRKLGTFLDCVGHPANKS